MLEERLQKGVDYANSEFHRLEVGTVQKEVVIGVIDSVDRENRRLEKEIGVIRGEEEVVRIKQLEAAAPLEEEFLQTKTIGLQEVRKNLQAWVPSMIAEVAELREKAITEVTREQAEEEMKRARDRGILTELIPGKAVFTRKAGTGKYKTRAVACGNLMTERPSEDLYASGVDSTQVRSLIRVGALRRWEAMVLDIKTAFLNAPTSEQELIFVIPPRVLVDAGVVEEGRVWKVRSALYGLVTAPRDWSNFRDSTLPELKEEVEIDGKKETLVLRPLGDANLWKVEELGSSEVVGYMAVYIDDIMVVASKPVTDAVAKMVRSQWSTSVPEYASSESMRFLGMELEKVKDGFVLHQRSYIQELLGRHGVEKGCSYVRNPEEESWDPPTPKRVKEAQGLTGELLWLSGKTRPDICVAVQKMAQSCLKNPCYAVKLGFAILAYLHETKDVGLVYKELREVDPEPELHRKRPRHAGTVEALVDASFAVEDGHSMTGIIILQGGAAVHWETRKQSLIALSTAESD